MNNQINDSHRDKITKIMSLMPMLLRALDEEDQLDVDEAIKTVLQNVQQTLIALIGNIPRVMFTSIEEDIFQSSPVHIRLEKNKGYWEFVHERLRDDATTQSFKAHYRMYQATFTKLVAELEQHPAFVLRSNNKTPVYMQIAVVIWRFANCHFGYRLVQATLGFSQGSLRNFTERFLDATTDRLMSMISWPSTEEDFEQVKKEFEFPNDDDSTIRRLPNVIGAVDGKLVVIHRPKEFSESFRDRKSNLSINLTAVADGRCRFRYVYVGESGRCHDARVFGRSEIPTMFENPDTYFKNNAFILGDSAYPLNHYLIVPYTQMESATDRSKAKFNAEFSAMRQVVERAFGMLVKRWRFLFKYVYILDHTRLVKVVISCCILHNFCIYHDDPISLTDDELRLFATDINDSLLTQNGGLEREDGLRRRDILKDYVNNN
jgi:hypothetical protein